MTDVALIRCANEDCARTVRDHYHGKAQAHEDGWFFQKDGNTWCPDHNPDWVAAWRARKAASQET